MADGSGYKSSDERVSSGAVNLANQTWAAKHWLQRDGQECISPPRPPKTKQNKTKKKPLNIKEFRPLNHKPEENFKIKEDAKV